MPSITRRVTDPERRTSVEAQILATTERLLAGGASFTELGVQRIAAEAGVARSTFYTHFRDKSELLMRLAHTMRSSGYEVAAAWRPADGLDALVEAFERVVALYRQYAPVLAAINEAAAYDPAVRGFWREGSDRFIDNTAEVLRDAQHAGRVAPDLDVEHASRIVVIGGDRAIADHVASNTGTAGDAAFARELAKIWWYGAYTRPSA